MTWNKVKLGDFLITREGRYKPQDKTISGLKRVEKIDFSGNIFLSDKTSNTDMIIVKKGDLLISGINVEKGAMAVYQGDEDVTATIHYSSYIFDEKKIDIEFLKYFLKSPAFRNVIKEQVPGGIKTEIKPKHLLALSVFIPTEIKEQKKIISAFKEVETKNNEINSELSLQLHLVKQLRKAFLNDAIQGKLVPQDETEGNAQDLLAQIKAEKAQLIKDKKVKQGKIQEADLQEDILFDIPQNWIWCQLDEITYNITDGTHQTPTYKSNGRIFLSAQNIKPFRFMPEEHKCVSEEAYQDYIKNRKATKGDILVARVGAGIGETAVIDKDIDFCFYVSLALIQPFQNYINSDYLAYVFNSPYGVLYSKGNISSKGGSAGNFNLGRIRSFLIPLPPLSEQNRIVQKLESLMQTCDALTASIKQSASENEQLLQQVLREALQAK